MLNSSSLSSLSIDMETAFSSSRSSPLNWDDCEDNATCDDVSLLEDDDDDELQSLQVCDFIFHLDIFSLSSPSYISFDCLSVCLSVFLLFYLKQQH